MPAGGSPLSAAGCPPQGDGRPTAVWKIRQQTHACSRATVLVFLFLRRCPRGWRHPHEPCHGVAAGRPTPILRFLIGRRWVRGTGCVRDERRHCHTGCAFSRSWGESQAHRAGGSFRVGSKGVDADPPSIRLNNFFVRICDVRCKGQEERVCACRCRSTSHTHTVRWHALAPQRVLQIPAVACRRCKVPRANVMTSRFHRDCMARADQQT